jgi:hypothetical protein
LSVCEELIGYRALIVGQSLAVFEGREFRNIDCPVLLCLGSENRTTREFPVFRNAIMYRCMATSTQAKPVGTIRQILAASAANNVVKFKASPPSLCGPVADSTPLVKQHVLALRQPLFNSIPLQHH